MLAVLGTAIGLRRDGAPAADGAADRSNPRARSAAARRSDAPRSDIGTVLLHWVVAAAMVASLVTGLRISADAPTAVISSFLSPILPQGEIWTVHFVSSLALVFTTTAYILYMARGGLKRRVSLKKLRVFTLPTAPKVRWGAANVALYWAFYLVLLTLTATGIALYLGFGGWVVAVHAVCAFVTIGYVVAHLIVHFGYGGWQQILRIFRPTRLVPNKATRTRPLLVATAVAVPAAIGLASYDIATRDVLAVAHADRAPRLDGVLDDEAWKAARPVFVRTMQGENLGGSGESTVEMRAVTSGSKVYFAFRWQDPTRSMMRLPLQKRADGWHLAGSRADIADVMDFYEDKLAILFAHNTEFGNGGSTHMGPRPLGDKPEPLHRRGYHYTTDGSILDVWQWKASRGGMLGYVDDMFFGPPFEPKPAEAAGTTRYQAGYTNDPGSAFYVYNYKPEPPGGYKGPVQLLRLPKDLGATTAAMGRIDLSPDATADDGSRWWMLEGETIPYSQEADAAIPVGTVIPGVLIMGEYAGDRADVRGAAVWKDGYWTLETSRELSTGSKYDVDFTVKKPLYAWLAVFDHNQTRHTRHMRPVRIEMR
ncbi:MAG TPA: ethylbenzene dehydrogenase-related protein [Beijerinckiaceae bacterium]|nr:ethylbenzene dehydrogenase-related protein [Beijerinckiaceae bacterium]